MTLSYLASKASHYLTPNAQVQAESGYRSALAGRSGVSDAGARGAPAISAPLSKARGINVETVAGVEA